MESPIQYLKRNVELGAYIMKHYPAIGLKPQGGNRFRGKCPFHIDKNPSFVVFPDGRYKCFSCPQQTSGDLINFVCKIEKLPEKEACELIANNEGLHIQFVPLNPVHETYFNQMTEHTRRYWRNLKCNPDALHYLHSRGISDSTIDLFRLGLTDPNEGAYRTDLLNISNRIAFPILEAKGSFTRETRTVAHGYRTMDPGVEPKYKNDANHDDPNDPLFGAFSKGKTLYGFAHAASSIRAKDYAILVEGYMDVLALHQSGATNSVASMGTSITDAQIDLLKSLTSNVLLWLDPDAAGIGSMESKIALLMEKGFKVSICLSQNLDPAELCLANGFDYALVASSIRHNSVPALKYMINKYTSEYSDAVIQLRANALNKLLPLIERTTPADRAIWTHELSKKLDINL